ncbi:MAG TPA: Ig-like domain-containing protein [Gemmatimonadales bacterium]|jgi:hypothetical protein
MSTARQLVYVALVGSALLSLDCGDSAGPVVAKTITAVEGTGQSGPTGATLATPFKVLVTGSNGKPYPGATVTWTVPTGAATPTPPTSATDADGYSSTVVTLGGQIGPVVVQASVPGVAPVGFGATALDPCTYVVSYTLGAVVNGALATTDCITNNFYYTDFYGLTFGTQQGLRITTTSTGFDTWLDVYRGNGDYLAFNDDIERGVITNSQIDFIAAPGSYVLAPNSFDEFTTGPYTLSAVSRSQTVENCDLVWVTRGVTVTDSVTAGDCSDTDSTGTYYSDAVAIIALAGSVLTIAQRSAAVDAFLALYEVTDSGLVLVTANDDSAGVGPNAHIVATVPDYAVYIVFMGTAGAGATGGYTVAISASATLAGTAAREVPEPLRVMPLPRMSKLRGVGTKPLPRSRPFR